MNDQAQTLRMLMARATRIARESSHSHEDESDRSACVAKCVKTESFAAMSSDFVASEASRFKTVAVDAGGYFADGYIAGGYEEASQMRAENLAPVDTPPVAALRSNDLSASVPWRLRDASVGIPHPSQSNHCHVTLLVGGRSGVGTTTLVEPLRSELSRRGGAAVSQSLAEFTKWCPPNMGVNDLPAQQWKGLVDSNIANENPGWMVIDGGSSDVARLERFWTWMDSVAVVTTTDAASVAGSYGFVKSAVHRGLDATKVRFIVSQAASENEARRVGRRLLRCCEQYLRPCHPEITWIPFHGTMLSGRMDGADSIGSSLRSWADDLEVQRDRNHDRHPNDAWQSSRPHQQSLRE